MDLMADLKLVDQTIVETNLAWLTSSKGIEDCSLQMRALVANSSLVIKILSLHTQVQDLPLVTQASVRLTKQGTGINQRP